LAIRLVHIGVWLFLPTGHGTDGRRYHRDESWLALDDDDFATNAGMAEDIPQNNAMARKATRKRGKPAR
jgi:hypothetical protein